MNLHALMSLIDKNTDVKSLTNVLLKNNPRLKPLYDQMKSSGMSEKEFVMSYARQNNINIEPIVQMFKNKGINF